MVDYVNFFRFLGNVLLVTIIVVLLRFVLTIVFSRKSWREVIMTPHALDHRNKYVSRLMNSAGVITTVVLLFKDVNIFLVIVASLCAVYLVKFAADFVLKK